MIARFLAHRWLNAALRLVIGGVFAYAAFEKVLHPAAFAIAVRVAIFLKLGCGCSAPAPSSS